MQRRAEFMVVQGVGGFCEPLGPNWDTVQMASSFGLPVVLVVGLRLGVIPWLDAPTPDRVAHHFNDALLHVTLDPHWHPLVQTT
jgi:hypothetical protein